MTGGWERIVEMTPAYDKRDPDPKKNYGIHGVDIRMVLKGAEGATQFVLSTGWLLPETVGLDREPWDWNSGHSHRYPDALTAHNSPRALSPMPVDLGYHSPRPMYEGQQTVGVECEYVPGGGPCYYDGSGLNCIRVFEVLLREGSEGVWRELADYYTRTFEAEATV